MTKHEHTKDCYQTKLTCGKQLHTHGLWCYKTLEGGNKKLTCKKAEHKKHVPTCNESVRICGKR